MEGHRTVNVAPAPQAYKPWCGDLRVSLRLIHSYQRLMQMNWWLGMTRDVALLGAESAEVMARRSLVLARADRAAWTEFQLMVSEKIAATVEVQSRLCAGAFGSNNEAAARSALNLLRRKVRANRRRLRK